MNIIFYNDTDQFGGHEKMFIELVKAYIQFAPHNKITIIISKSNNRLHDEIMPITSNIVQIDYYYSIKNRLFQSRYSKSIINTINSIDAEYIWLIQGDIEIGSIILTNKSKLNCKIISYIPLIATWKQRKAKFGMLRDIMNNHLYYLPDYYVTLTNSFRSFFSNFIPIERCFVLNNFCSYDQSQLPAIEYQNNTILISGRIEFNQKGQDFIVEVIHDNKEFFNKHNIKLTFLGSGKDRDKLSELIDTYNLNSICSMEDWTNNTAPYFMRSSIIVIPSYYEGFPLVLLDSINYKKPILMSNCEGSEILPPEFVYEKRNKKDFMSKLSSIIDILDNNVNTYYSNKFNTLYSDTLNQYSKTYFNMQIDQIIKTIENRK